MPLPWATAFKLIPWSDVIAAAPDVVRAAAKLWRESRQKPAPAPSPSVSDDADLPARLAELEAQVQASTELLSTLAMQNQRLVDAVDVLRMRTRWLALACAGLGLALLLRGTGG